MSDITDFKYTIVHTFKELKEALIKDIKEVVITTPYETDISERENKEENISEKEVDRKLYRNSITEKKIEIIKKICTGDQH